MRHEFSVNKVHDTSFGFKLTEIRDNKNMNRKELGKFLGVSESTIWAWECGVHFPRISMFLKVCELLEVTPNDLLGY